MPEDSTNAADLKPMKPEEARAQSAEYLGIPVGIPYDIGGGDTWLLPAQAFMPPDMRKRYTEHLQQMVNGLDMESRPNPISGVVTEQPVWPNQIDGVLIDEAELLCRALMGDETYERFVNAGGVPGEIQIHWRVMDLKLQERQRRDPKFR